MLKADGKTNKSQLFLISIHFKIKHRALILCVAKGI